MSAVAKRGDLLIKITYIVTDTFALFLRVKKWQPLAHCVVRFVMPTPQNDALCVCTFAVVVLCRFGGCVGGAASHCTARPWRYWKNGFCKNNLKMPLSGGILAKFMHDKFKQVCVLVCLFVSLCSFLYINWALFSLNFF